MSKCVITKCFFARDDKATYHADNRLQCKANILCAPLQPAYNGDIPSKIQLKAKFI